VISIESQKSLSHLMIELFLRLTNAQILLKSDRSFWGKSFS
jgi:hypothetical protein